MQGRPTRQPARHRGMVLITSLLLLLVMTILGVAMLRTFGIEERTAGNTREKQRAIHAAESAQTYAEWWLSALPGSNATSGAQCDTVSLTPGVCSNPLQSVTTLPWNAGVSYMPPMLTVASPGTADGYYAAPGFYVTFLTSSYDPASATLTQTYQVDAHGYGGTQNAAAVVESDYSVNVTHSTRTDDSKYLSLGGP
jgi:type IV pilus assembly protein PilX